jgi:hypothetical protein
MTTLTTEQINIINAVKDKIYKKLSYTNQSYNEIILDIIDLFKDPNKLNTKWDNISEADIMFIFMSILAAHKDMLNYMIDYRSLESYMGTAREDQSIKRIANSFGFKLPSYKAGRALVELQAGTITLTKFQSLIDSSGVVWTYLGDDKTVTTESGDRAIELFQGTKFSVDNIDPRNFTNNSTRTHKISNKAVAIGNTYNNTSCSLLYSANGTEEDTIVFTEVDSIYNYNGDDEVYELFVDTIGETCIKLPYNIDISTLPSNSKFNFRGLITSGDFVDGIDIIETEDYTLSPVIGEFYRGANPPNKDIIKDLFKNYYNVTNTLVTLYEYKNYILNKQKFIPGISKCLIADIQHDTSGGEGSSLGEVLNIGVYLLKDDNEELGISDDTEGLLEDLQNRTVSGLTIHINNMGESEGSPVEPLTEVPIEVQLAGSVDINIKEIVIDYINSIGIGGQLSQKGISDALSAEGYNFYGKVTLTSPTPEDGVVQLAFNEYASLDEADITEV